MSSKGVQPQKGVQRGVKAGRSSVMLLATPEMVEALKLPPPKGQLDVLPQSFQGRPSPPIEVAEAKIRKAAQENPLLMPGMGPKLSMSKMASGLSEAPIAKVKKLRMVKETPDYQPLERGLPMDNLENIREHMTVREDGSSIPEDYMQQQTDIEKKKSISNRYCCLYTTDTAKFSSLYRGRLCG